MVVNMGRRQMNAEASGWKFDEEEGIGITSEYPPPHTDPPHTHTPNKILINYKGKKNSIII